MLGLRGHHLICLHFFHGEGYDAAFIGNLQELLSRTTRDAVRVVEGPDDVCRRCPHLRNDRCSYHTDSEAEVQKMDESALRLLRAGPGDEVRWDRIRQVLPDVFAGWYESYCASCDWRSACEKDAHFRTVKVSLTIP